MNVGKRNKYGNKWAEVDGIRFQSTKEAQRYQELKLMERAGAIRDLELQPEFELIPSYVNANGKRIRATKYRADFRYYDNDYGKWVVEDVKSPATKTQVYKVKKKLFEYLNDMTITEV